MNPTSQTSVICNFIASAADREYPSQVLDEARKALVDWFGVSLAAVGSREGRYVASVVAQWGMHGDAPLLGEGTSSAAGAAMVNGTLSHCLDFDDTHIPSAVHVSAPLWAALLAVGCEQRLPETLLLRAFVTAFEITARIGAKVGVRLVEAGWHATAVMGRLGACAGVAVLLGLDAKRSAHGLAIAATQAGGLTASFGTMAKPLHAGKAAADGVFAAQLAQQGFEGPPAILDRDSALLRTLLQDPSFEFEMADLPGAGDKSGWEIARNSYKPYAACQLTHGAIDAARSAAARIDVQQIEAVRVHVHPLAAKVANVRNATTPTEAKFSMGHCIALALHGSAVNACDFAPEKIARREVATLAGRVETIPSENVTRTGARLELLLRDGARITRVVEHALGSVHNPMGWTEIEAKFRSLVEPAIGAARCSALLGTLHHFEAPGSLGRMFELASLPPPA